MCVFYGLNLKSARDLHKPIYRCMRHFSCQNCTFRRRRTIQPQHLQFFKTKNRYDNINKRQWNEFCLLNGRNLLRNNNNENCACGSCEVAKADTISQCSFGVFLFLFSRNLKQKAHEAWSVWPEWHHQLSWPYQTQLAAAMGSGLCVWKSLDSLSLVIWYDTLIKLICWCCWSRQITRHWSTHLKCVRVFIHKKPHV